MDGRRAEHSLIPPKHPPLALKKKPKRHFPSLSPSALLRAYWRLSTEDRIRRASRTSIPITASRDTVKDFPSAPKAQPACSSIEQGTSRFSCPAFGTITRSENNIETLALAPPSPAGRYEPIISNNSDSSRYELRPNRPSSFPPRPQYLVDRHRFPHFFRSYKYSLDQHGFSDSDYTPPSRTPTPSSSDRSLSILSGLPSAASSLELFGLEVRSLQSSDRGSASTDRPNDVSSPDFFSSEEHTLPT